MNLIGRALWLFLKRMLVRIPLDPFATCVTPFRVNLLDLDVNMHMNNGRYLSIMDLGRVDLMLRVGAFWRLSLAGYYPVVVSQGIRFKQSLQPFQKFTLHTRLESWDEKNFYVSQQFMRGDQLVADGYIKARFKRRGQKGSTPTREMFEVMGVKYEREQITNLAKSLDQLDSQLTK